MTSRLTACALAALALQTTGVATADVTIPPMFSDGAVLQRHQEVPVWGTAAPGEQVMVGFAGQELSTSADAEGNWLVHLAPLGATTGFMHSDQRQPGSNRARATETSPMRTTSMTVLSEVRVSSGWSKGGR